MRHIYRIYRQLFRSNVTRMLLHRVDALNGVFSSLLWGVFSIIAVFVLTSPTRSIFGWSQSDILLLAVSYALIVGVFHIFWSKNFPLAARIIHYGQLDMYLSKPRAGLLLLIGSEINIPHLIRFSTSFILLWYVIHHYGYVVSIGQFVSYALLCLVGTSIFLSIHILFLTILLYQSSLSNIMEFGSLLTSSARYPIDILRIAPLAARLVFLPVMLAINVPVKVLIGRATPQDAVLFVGFALLLFLIALGAWNRSLRMYTGASG